MVPALWALRAYLDSILPRHGSCRFTHLHIGRRDEIGKHVRFRFWCLFGLRVRVSPSAPSFYSIAPRKKTYWVKPSSGSTGITAARPLGACGKKKARTPNLGPSASLLLSALRTHKKGA